jgi:hypothetical protein
MSKWNIKDCTNFLQYKKEKGHPAMPKGIAHIRARCREISGQMSPVLNHSHAPVDDIDVIDSCDNDSSSSENVGIFHLEENDLVDIDTSTNQLDEFTNNENTNAILVTEQFICDNKLTVIDGNGFALYASGNANDDNIGNITSTSAF